MQYIIGTLGKNEDLKIGFQRNSYIVSCTFSYVCSVVRAFFPLISVSRESCRGCIARYPHLMWSHTFCLLGEVGAGFLGHLAS